MRLDHGLSAEKKGLSISLFEKNGEPGGVIKSKQEQEWLLEGGPNTIMARSEQLWNLIDQLGLNDQIVQTGKEASRRYIVKDGRPTPLPQSLMQFAKTDLLSISAKFRLFKEPFIEKGDSLESIADFFERRLGTEVVDYAVNPFVAGIYAGDPKKLSIRHTLSKVYELEQKYGSIIKGAVKSRGNSKPKSAKSRHGLISFKKGIQQLPKALGEKLGDNIHYECPISSFKRRENRWTLSSADEIFSGFDALLYTAPLHQLSPIVIQMEKARLVSQLNSMPYAPVAIVSLGFPIDQIEHSLDGFGMLVPEVEPFNILGVLFSSSLFQGRAPQDHALLTCFAGGQRNPEHVNLPDDRLIKMVTDDLDQLLGCSGEPVFSSIHHWKKAIPQFGLNHQNYLDLMEELETANPGFYMTGNFRREVSVPGCIEQAYETAGRIASFFESRV
ncbi:MAG: protoporphyrinogen oxidase [Balneolaceae bacterium]|nr:protoporphyrinogen oxidase [Balneolaceae bacterium]